MSRPGSILALDTGSPTVSVALALLDDEGDDGVRLAERAVEIGRSSRRLLGMIDEVLGEGGLAPADLGGVVALAGPGSFTGLRIGLATALGLHQATGVPAVAVPTLEVLALAGSPAVAAESAPPRVVAAVDVLRGEWAVQEFRRAENDGGLVADGAAERVTAGELAGRLAAETPVRTVGFGIGGLAVAFHAGGTRPDDDFGDSPRRSERPSGPAVDAAAGPALPPGIELAEPPPLAAVAARRALARPWHGWDAGTLTAPIYFRPPAATLPRPRR